MKRILASVLSAMLVASMVFGAASTAFADEPLPQDSYPVSEQIILLENTSDTPAQPEIILAQPVVEETPLLPEQTLGSALPSSGGLTITMATTALAIQEYVDEPALEAKGVQEDTHELVVTVNNLYIKTHPTPANAILRTNEGDPLSESLNLATFEKGSYFTEIEGLVQRINELLKALDFLGVYTVSASSLTCEYLPDGFEFDGDDAVLKVTDLDLFNRTEDEERLGALTRTYQITLQSNVQFGSEVDYVNYILGNEDMGCLVVSTFDIELQLNLPEVTDPSVPPPPPTDGTNPPLPPIVITPPGDDGQTGGDGDGGENGGGYAGTITNNNNYPGAGATNSAAAVAANAALAIVGSSETTPEDTPTDSDDGSSKELMRNIEDQAIPMASIMIDDSGNLIFANASLVILSLLLSGASLVSLRMQRKPDSMQLPTATAQSSQLGQTMGTFGIVLGVASAILMLLSQYVDDTALISGVSWTPVLITICIVQVACAVGLYTSGRAAQKKTLNPRYNIRL